MFDLKKFIALIAVENRLMQLFYDKAEASGLHPTFDVYHVMAGDEKPSKEELQIMKGIFEFNVKGTEYEAKYLTADVDFPDKIAERNRERRLSKRNNNPFRN